MNDEDFSFEYDDLDTLKRVFSICYTQLVLQSQAINIPDEAYEVLGDLEDRLMQVIRERACH